MTASCRSARLLIGLAVFTFSARSLAQDPPAGSVVTTVQPPAWIVHEDKSSPLMPGTAVHDGDQLRTAAGGRIYFALPEHSTVKLGENTEFATAAMDMTADSQGSLFKAAMKVLKGVFRFTTSLEAKIERRDVQIQVVTATIGIRGTDVWGRAGGDGGLVCLLEGRIAMDMPGQTGMKMEDPMHYTSMDASGGMKMNVAVSAEKVADWSAQTDVKPGSGVLSTDGHWVIALRSSPDRADSQPLRDQLATAGYPAEDSIVSLKGRSWHRLIIRQVASYRDAHTLADRLGALGLGLKPWIYSTTATARSG